MSPMPNEQSLNYLIEYMCVRVTSKKTHAHTYIILLSIEDEEQDEEDRKSVV